MSLIIVLATIPFILGVAVWILERREQWINEALREESFRLAALINATQPRQGEVMSAYYNSPSLECERCQTGHPSRTAIFNCSACQAQICDSCKNEHRCNEVYCGYCDELTDHLTVNCVLPIVN